MAGLAPANIRLPDPAAVPASDVPGEDIIVEVADNDGDMPQFDDGGAILSIEHGDGSVTVSLDGRPLNSPANENNPAGWFENLADKIDGMEVSRIAEDLLRGIESDLSSRKDWIEDHEQGLKLLGLKLELPGVQGASDGAPIEGMSKVRHPLLLEAVLRFQANARSEMLPTDGPVKIRNDDNNADLQKDQLANALQQDMNHYLTSTASEYYPDTDRMFLRLGFGGTAFKKVYFCPIRSRPVSETVLAADLIVNNAATDLGNARRVTHRILMRPSVVRRMQILGVYRDVELSTPNPQKLDSLQREEKAQQGLAPDAQYPEDRDRELYECYCELDVKGFEHKLKGTVTGLEIPYRVTIDLTSRQILSIVRNYNEETRDLPVARKTFVQYVFVPGFGFYPIGLLHILANTTNALTAAERELLDNGMYANFPGFLIAKAASRQNTTLLRVPPGGGQQVDTQGMKIGDAVMPLPYKTEGMAALMSLVEHMEEMGQRVGGTAELQVGEGKQDAPVGTTLALIDQATKVMNSVHKRMHSAQSEEFSLIVQCFREHPESFWQVPGRSGYAWDEQAFLDALQNYQLVPQADPNTASYTQRVMKVVGLKQAQANSPALYDPIAVERAVLQALGWGNPQEFLLPPGAAQQPPPELMQAMAKMQSDKAKGDASMLTAQARMLEAKTKGLGAAQQGNGQQEDTPVDVFEAQTKRMEAETKRHGLSLEARRDQIEDQNRDLDRQTQQRDSALALAKELVANHADGAQVAREMGPIEKAAGEH